jgi:hypothetical protein
LWLPEQINQWSIGGRWSITPEYIEAVRKTSEMDLSQSSGLELHFAAKKVFLVVSSGDKKWGTLEVRTLEWAGWRAKSGTLQTILVKEDSLYTVFESDVFQPDASILIVASPWLRLHAFTFWD